MRLLLALRNEKNESENKNKTKISGLGGGAEWGGAAIPLPTTNPLRPGLMGARDAAN